MVLPLMLDCEYIYISAKLPCLFVYLKYFITEKKKINLILKELV